MNSIYLFGNLMSMVSSGSLKLHESKDEYAKRFNKLFNTGFSNLIPKIVTHGIIVQGKFLKTGTIVIRPLAKEFLTKISGEYHYAIVLGTDADGILYFLEMTNYPHNIRIANIKEFLDGYLLDRLEIHDIPKKDFTPEDIYVKAKRFEDTAYSILNLNCKDIAFYCIYDVEPERRADVINQCMLIVNEMCIKLDEIQIQYATDQIRKEFHQENITRLKEERKTISESIRNSDRLLSPQK